VPLTPSPATGGRRRFTRPRSRCSGSWIEAQSRTAHPGSTHGPDGVRRKTAPFDASPAHAAPNVSSVAIFTYKTPRAVHLRRPTQGVLQEPHLLNAKT
jgi:hypothetical protein